MKLFFLLIFVTTTVQALEIDEKLTLRVVDTSETRKTVLINRGIEDGLAQNDHAKFYISTGVVARGVCIKTSPTRSVWSMYRLVNTDFIRKDQVLKLKITPAVKITKDESRMLVEDDTASSLAKDPRDLGIPLAEGADDLIFEQRGNRSDRDLLDDEISLLLRNKEIYGMASFSAFTEKASPDTDLDDFSEEVNNFMLRIGGEWYFKREDAWYTRFSAVFNFTYERETMQGFQGTAIEETNNEFGFGINLYPFKRPSMIHNIIHYFNYTFSLGTSSSRFSTGAEAGIGNRTSEVVDGSVLANSFGYGMKYYTTEGFGFRMLFSYYLRGETFGEDSSSTEWIKTRIGPRLLLGISKRF